MQLQAEPPVQWNTWSSHHLDHGRELRAVPAACPCASVPCKLWANSSVPGATSHALLQAPVGPARIPQMLSRKPKYSVISEELLTEGLARIEQRRRRPNERDRAYLSLLKAMIDWELLDSLPLDHGGRLQVSAPFCGGFSETPLLLPFLAQRFLGHSGSTSLSIFACDLEEQPVWWTVFQEWAARSLPPNVELQFGRQDLEHQALPPSGLIIAVHPRATLFGPWYNILANVLHACLPGSICIIATFFDCEAQAVTRICQSLGVSVEVRQNPFYEVEPMPTFVDECGVEATPLRYVVIVRK